LLHSQDEWSWGQKSIIINEISNLPLIMPHAIINAMNLKIDRAGRIVLPKKVRDRLRLRPGSNLQLEEHPEGLVLRPAAQRPSMIKRDGLWVHMGKAPRGFNWNDMIDEDRDERIKDILNG